MEITHEMIRQAWLAAHSVETEDRCNNEMLRRAIDAVVPLILEEAAKADLATVPQLKRCGHEKPREFVLLASYCGDDTPGCTDTTPCADCLAMCNVFGEDGTYLRELGPRAALPHP